MKILWFSKVLSEQDNGTTGTWMDSMARGLIDSGEVEFGNIAWDRVREITRRDFGPVHQWLVPSNTRLGRDKLPSSKITGVLIKAIDEFSPDLIHVWGTEEIWGLLTARKLIHRPALLDIQGLKGVYARVYNGNLSFKEQLACIGLKEVLLGSSIFQKRQSFKAWETFDKEIISGHKYISIHSDWAVSQIKAINSSATIFRNERVLRKPFYNFKPRSTSEKPILFCSAAYPTPYKGLHIVIRCLPLLKKRFPDIQLRIAGAHQRPGIRRDGYISWINREISRSKIEDQVSWLGPLTAEQLVDELINCSVFILPTFAETYCVALAEAMILGVPTVVSYTGGTSYLAKDQDSALFFTPGDEAMCAYQIERLLTDTSLAERLSCRAREVSLVRNNPDLLIQNQVKIYRLILEAIK
jgi:glycosyltransferase involved in cell wall biosynthesis